MTVTITVNDVKDALAVYGVTNSLTDAQITSLIDYKTSELSELIDVPIGLIGKEYIVFDFNNDRVFLPYYPVDSITSFKQGTTDITGYTLKKNDGYIKLSDKITGDITINYQYGLTLTNSIKHLIIDMIVSQLKYGVDGSYSSVREGDVSVSYNGNSFNTSIQSRIDNLRNTYTGRLRLL